MGFTRIDASKPARNRKWTLTRHYEFDAMKAELEGKPRPTEEEWKESIRAEFQPDVVIAYVVVLIFHDQDKIVSDSGGVVDKGLHVHIVFHFTQSITDSMATARMKPSRPENMAPITSKKNYVKALLYLTHSTEKARKERKYEYDVSAVEVYVRDGYSFDYREARFGKIDAEDKLEQELQRDAQLYYTQQVVDGRMTVDEVQLAGYIRDEFDVGFDDLVWKKHRNGYEQDRKDYVRRVAKEYAKPGVYRSLSMVYIKGEQSTGKTELAEGLANRWGDGKPFHSVAAHGADKTFDFAGNYDAEPVSIVNELSPSYLPEEFCNTFDPIHAGMVNSRNSDKPWYANYCINTTSMHPEEFLWHLYLPFAKGRIPVGDKELHGDVEWQKHYESVPTVASKISEMRRRWNIWVNITDYYESAIFGGTSKKLVRCACIMFRTDAHNPQHCYYLPNDQAEFQSLIKDGKAPWVEYKIVPYRSEADLDGVIDAIEEALHLYYEINAYSVTPWNTPRPDFAKLREAKKDKAGSEVTRATEPLEVPDAHACDGNENGA